MLVIVAGHVVEVLRLTATFVALTPNAPRSCSAAIAAGRPSSTETAALSDRSQIGACTPARLPSTGLPGERVGEPSGASNNVASGHHVQPPLLMVGLRRDDQADQAAIRQDDAGAGHTAPSLLQSRGRGRTSSGSHRPGVSDRSGRIGGLPCPDGSAVPDHLLGLTQSASDPSSTTSDCGKPTASHPGCAPSPSVTIATAEARGQPPLRVGPSCRPTARPHPSAPSSHRRSSVPSRRPPRLAAQREQADRQRAGQCGFDDMAAVSTPRSPTTTPPRHGRAVTTLPPPDPATTRPHRFSALSRRAPTDRRTRQARVGRP